MPLVVVSSPSHHRLSKHRPRRSGPLRCSDQYCHREYRGLWVLLGNRNYHVYWHPPAESRTALERMGWTVHRAPQP